MSKKQRDEFFPSDEEDEFLRVITEKAKGDLLYVATRLLEVTARYFQFRMREVITRGIYFTHTYHVEYTDKGARLILEITIPDDIIEKYKKEYAKKAKTVKKLIRSAKLRDRHYYYNKPLANIVEEEFILKETEKEQSGGENVSDGGDQDSSSKGARETKGSLEGGYYTQGPGENNRGGWWMK